MDPPVSTEQRKRDHIRINLEEPVQHREVTTGLERYRFVHNAVPELDLEAVDLRATFLGRTQATPLLISSMTGGVERGWEITRALAVAAREVGAAIGVGSQRAAIEDPDRARWYAVRNVAPNVLLFANLGAIQLNNGYGVDHCRRAVEMIGADALVLHLNALQEALQPEGNQNFAGLLDRIAAVCAALEVPVIVKEVGFGMSADVARRLAAAGVAAIDASGAGGTSWSAVEHHRSTTEHQRRVSETFIEWGIPTATSLRMVRQGAPRMPLIASGGLRNGLDAAKALALGADLAGFAGPMLRAAAEGETAAVATLTAIRDELRLAMFATGAATVADLRHVPLLDERGEQIDRDSGGSAAMSYDGKTRRDPTPGDTHATR
jgi:isopentenyl-diphosphate delta-isomerase